MTRPPFVKRRMRNDCDGPVAPDFRRSVAGPRSVDRLQPRRLVAGPARVVPEPVAGGPSLVKVNGILVAPVLVPYIQALRAEARRLGASFRLVSGFRPPQQQRALREAWLRGRPVPGRAGWRITSRGLLFKPAAWGYHQSALAIDLESNMLARLGVYAERLGMRWGGRYGDEVHFDLGRKPA